MPQILSSSSVMQLDETKIEPLNQEDDARGQVWTSMKYVLLGQKYRSKKDVI